MTNPLRRADEDGRYLFELRHGAYLTSQLLQSVAYSGDGNDSTGRVGLFDKDPALKAAHERAFDAVFDYYLLCGEALRAAGFDVD